MINKIQQSIYVKHTALLLVVCIFCMSFRMRGTGEIMLNAGTNIPLETVSTIQSDLLRAQKAKGLGKEGFVEIQIKSVTAADDQEVFLTGGNVYQEGDDKQTLSIVLGVLVCILFLTMKGKNAQVPAGFQVTPSVATNMSIKV